MNVARGMPVGGRTIRTRVRIGAFTGDVIEHIAHPALRSRLSDATED